MRYTIYKIEITLLAFGKLAITEKDGFPFAWE
jgi:hypothetical protein